MEPTEFPSNSFSRKSEPEEPKLERITTGEAKRKKRSLRKQFAETFVAGDLKSSFQYGIFDIFLPYAQDTVVEVIHGFVDKLFRGDGRRRVGSTTPQSGPGGVVNYQHFAMGQGLTSSARALSRAARARHNFDEIVLDSRMEAEQVIDQLIEVVSRYGETSVADLYQLVGVAAAHTDHKWGWTDLRGAGVSRHRDGYLLDLPDPQPLR